MSNYPTGAENDPNAPYNQNDNDFECSECGTPLSSDKGVCSKECYKSSML